MQAQLIDVITKTSLHTSISTKILVCSMCPKSSGFVMLINGKV